MLEHLQVAGAPKPGGPYATVVRAGDFLFLSGQGPVDAETGVMQWEANTAEQTRIVLHNLQKVLRGCGAELKDIVKCSVFLLDVRDFAVMNEVYAEILGDQPPARTTVVTGMVAEGMKVEIDCIAYCPTPATLAG